MSKKIRILSLITAIVLASTALVGCGSKGSGESSSKAEGNESEKSSSKTESSEVEKAKDPVTLEFIVPQNGPMNDWDIILKEFEARTKDTLNTKLNVTITGFDDIGQKTSLKMTSGQSVDSIFTAQWTNPSVQSMSLKEQVLQLDSYFNNDEYPGLKAQFGEDYINQNKFVGKDGKLHVYGIPFSHEYGGATYVYYRADLAEKYGIGEIADWAGMIKYFEAILENEKGMDPFVMLGSNDAMNGMAGDSVFAKPILEKHNSKDAVVIKDDGTAYVSRNIIPALDPEYMKWIPEGSFKDNDPLYSYKAIREWYEKGYISKDILNVKDHQGMFTNGKAASFPRGVDTYSGIKTQLETSIKGAKLGVVNLDPNKEVPKSMGSDFQAWNFAAIPANSKNADRTMDFYNWIYEDAKNLDLFEYGIEGKHWTAEGEDGYIPQANPDTGKDFNFGSYVMTWNPNMRRFDASAPDFVTKELKKGSDANMFYKNVTSGFSFNAEPIKSLDAQVAEIKSGLLAISNGTVADIEGEIAKINARLEKIGYDKWCAEYEKQFNEFLKMYPYQGQ